MNSQPGASLYWNAAIDDALRRYQSLWVESGDDSLYAAWCEESAEASFLPYDCAEVLIGLNAICGHLAARQRISRLSHVSWRLLTSWRHANGDCSIAQQDLVTVDRRTERREARSHVIVVATVGQGAAVRLRHLSEATPAALVEIRKSYERHAASRNDL